MEPHVAGRGCTVRVVKNKCARPVFILVDQDSRLYYLTTGARIVPASAVNRSKDKKRRPQAGFSPCIVSLVFMDKSQASGISNTDNGRVAVRKIIGYNGISIERMLRPCSVI